MITSSICSAKTGVECCYTSGAFLLGSHDQLGPLSALTSGPFSSVRAYERFSGRDTFERTNDSTLNAAVADRLSTQQIGDSIQITTTPFDIDMASAFEHDFELLIRQ